MSKSATGGSNKQKRDQPDAPQPKTHATQVKARALLESQATARAIEAASPGFKAKMAAASVKPIAVKAASVATARPMVETAGERAVAKALTEVKEHDGMPLPGTKAHHGKMHFEMMQDGSGRGRGTEYIAQLKLENTGVVPTTVFAGTILATQQMNPQMFGVRIGPVTSPYNKYKFTKLRFEYVPSITQFQDASNDNLILACSLTPATPVPTDVATLMTWAGYREDGEGKCNANYGHFTKPVHLNSDLQLAAQIPLFIDTTDDQLFQVQAKFAAVVAQDVLAPVGITTPGFVLVHYEIECWGESAPAYGSGAVMAQTFGMPDAAVGNAVISANPTGDYTQFTQWTGDAGLVLPVDYARTGGNFVLTPGAYVVCANWYNLAAVAYPAAYATLTPVSSTAALMTADSFGGPPIYLNATPDVDGQQQLATFQPGGGYSYYTRPDGTRGTAAQLAFSQRWTVIASAGVPAVFLLNGPTGSVGTFNATLTVCRVLGAAEVASSQQVVGRGGPISLVTAKIAQMLDQLPAKLTEFDAATTLIFLNYCLTAPDSEAPYINVIIKAFNLKAPLRRYGPTACHPALSVLLWLGRTFGPVIAGKMLDVGRDKLDKWIKQDKKKKQRDPDFDCIATALESTTVSSKLDQTPPSAASGFTLV